MSPLLFAITSVSKTFTCLQPFPRHKKWVIRMSAAASFIMWGQKCKRSCNFYEENRDILHTY
jgi:hypothetical protein